METPIYRQLCADLGRDPLDPVNNCFLRIKGMSLILNTLLAGVA